VRPLDGSGNVLSSYTCDEMDTLLMNIQTTPEACMLYSHFDFECGCSNAEDRLDELVPCDLCGTGKRVNERYDEMLEN
jgi:hypothetical protein